MLRAMVPKHGPCRLGLVDCDRRESHIMPAWSFRRVVPGVPGDARVLHVTAEATIAMHRQPREYLLCGGCEGRVSVWEDYASRVLARADGTFPWLTACRPLARRDDLEIMESSGIDTGTLCLFAASVIGAPA